MQQSCQARALLSQILPQNTAPNSTAVSWAGEQHLPALMLSQTLHYSTSHIPHVETSTPLHADASILINVLLSLQFSSSWRSRTARRHERSRQEVSHSSACCS